MEAIQNQAIMKINFGGSKEGTYKIDLNKKKEYEIEFLLDLEECLSEVDYSGVILKIYNIISNEQKLPPLAWITVKTELMSIRLREKNLENISISGEGKNSWVMGRWSPTPFVHIHFLTEKRPSPSKSITKALSDLTV